MEHDCNINLDFQAFLRSVAQNIDTTFSFLLGAGASISSGIQNATDCIWDWKYELYKSNHLNKDIVHPKYSVKSKNIVQNWLDSQPDYPLIGSAEEYSFYAERAYPIEEDRVNYFQNLSLGIEPYVGYKLLCLLNKFGFIRTVWSTNFDGLVERAAHQLQVTPININLDNPDWFYKHPQNNLLHYVALHGDYKYASLKNTEKELDNQNEVFIKALKHCFVNQHLVVIGYSGRDKSLMSALKEAFSENGAGRLYWCGYGADIPDSVKELIISARNHGRNAFYINTEGFDQTMLALTNYCFDSDMEKKSLIQDVINSYPKTETIKPFEIKTTSVETLLNTNLLPIVFPKEFLKVEIDKRLTWDELRSRINGHDIVAVPYGKYIYALSSISIVNEVFQQDKIGSIDRCPLTIDDIEKTSAFTSLMLDACIHSISSTDNLCGDKRKKLIWKAKQSEIENGILEHEAVKIDFVFKPNVPYAFMTIRPTLYFESVNPISKESKNLLTRRYLDHLYNGQYQNKIKEWTEVLFGGKRRTFKIPCNSDNGFVLQISNNTGYIELSSCDSQFRQTISSANYDQRRTIFNGMQIVEPKLKFQAREHTRFVFDENPMRGLINGLPFDHYTFNQLAMDITLGVICPSSKSTDFHRFLSGLNVKTNQTAESNYVTDYNGFENIYKCRIDIPKLNSDRWKCVENNGNPQQTVRAICEQANILAATHPGIVVTIFIPSSWSSIRSFENNGEAFDLHDYIKAFSAKNGYTTQLVEEKTLAYNMRCEKLWWLSLAIFVKSLRSPWSLADMDSNTAFAGIGYSIKKDRHGKSKVVLGCSHIYNAEGQGLKYKLSPVQNPQFDNKNNPYLTFEEAYKFGMTICELFRNSMDEFPQRVVIHKRTPFKKDEIDGIVAALNQANISDIDLISITFETDIRAMIQKLSGSALIADSFPLRRGSCVKLSSRKALLWTDGRVPSIQQYRSYYPSGKGIPSPLLITKYHGDGDLYTIGQEILGLCKMNWNSFNYYTKLPATIDTSNTLAHIGNLLSNGYDKVYDYRFFM